MRLKCPLLSVVPLRGVFGKIVFFSNVHSSGKTCVFHNRTIMHRGYGVGGLFRHLASGLLLVLPRIGKDVASTALEVVRNKMRGVPLSETLKNVV